MYTNWFLIIIIGSIIQLTYGYSKYGRSCDDQNCLTGERCVIVEDQCSSYNMEREGQCGKRPTCVNDGRPVVKDCSTYQCPPTHRCFMDGGVPKCIPGASSNSNIKTNLNDNKNQAYQPSAPSLYPEIPPGNNGALYPGTTHRPRPRPENQYPSGPGYSGGSVGSGYPGYQRPQNQQYPQQPQYPNRPQYPQQPQYPQYPQYPQQPNHYNPQSPYGYNRPGSTTQKSSSGLFGGDAAKILLNLGKKVLSSYINNPPRNNNNFHLRK